MYNIILYIILATGSNPSFSAIKGNVINSVYKNSIPFASINVYSGDKVVARSESDFNGNYIVTRLPAGNYKIVTIAECYSDTVDNVVTTEKDTTTVNILLCYGSEKDNQKIKTAICPLNHKNSLIPIIYNNTPTSKQLKQKSQGRLIIKKSDELLIGETCEARWFCTIHNREFH